MIDKLGHYIWLRINKDQEVLKQTKPMHMSGLYVSPKHIQKYMKAHLQLTMKLDIQVNL